MKKKTNRYCVYCAHFGGPVGLSFLCMRPVYLENGEMAVFDCHQQRRTDCGPQARYWQPKKKGGSAIWKK